MTEHRNYGNGNSANGLEMANSNQELVSKQRRRGLRTIAAAVVTGLVVLVLIIVAAVLLSDSPPKRSQKPESLVLPEHGISLDDILERKFGVRLFNGTWISDTEILYRHEEGHLYIYDLPTNSQHVILIDDYLIPSTGFLFELSADKKFLRIAHGFTKVFRHSYEALYNIINLETRTSFPLENVEDSQDGKTHQLVVWSPQGNAFVYVHKNNIFYRPSASEGVEFKLTEGGILRTIYHGIPDWVYEEEVFSSNKAVYFSPDGTKLAYASFNDTETRIMNIPFYGLPNSLEFQYTRNMPIRYPKPGTPNPVVSLGVIDLKKVENGVIKSDNIPPPADLLQKEPILSAVKWANEDEILAVWTNRVQNVARVVVCNSQNTLCDTVLSVEEKSGWVDILTPPVFSSDGKKMVLILPQMQDTDSGAFRHVTLVQRSKPTPKATALTSGKFVVTEIQAWDESRNTIYFLATVEGDPSQLHLYGVSDNPVDAPHKARCISCDVKSHSGKSKCLYNHIEFSKNNSYYALSCVGPDVPEMSLYDKDHKLVTIWEANNNVRELLRDKMLPKILQLEVDVPGGLKALVHLSLPPNMDTSGKTKYPMLVNVYGGPDSFQVTQSFKVEWSTYLTVNKSIIYAMIDGRGSGLKGNKMLFAGYRHLGTVEIEDQINVARYLQDHMDYIDRERTAIWGWSYGGYSTGMVLANDTGNVFKCGISVAPVSDWLYYDTIYTERYMGLPTVDDNLEGYNESSLNNKVGNLRNKKFMLIHGTLDDNVHYQQSMMLSKALEIQDIFFNQQTYPDEEHGLVGVRPHLYHTLGKFLDECYGFE